MVEQWMDELRRQKSGGREHQNHDGENTKMKEWDDGGARSGIYVSSDGRIISIDDLLDDILSKDENKKRRFSN